MQIVVALREVMAERGYDGATIAAIAERAGLLPGLVHYHFPSKQAILLALVADLASTLLQRMEAHPGDPLDQAIDGLLSTDNADAERVRCWVLVMAEALRQPEVRVVVDAALADLLTQLTQAVEARLNTQQRSVGNASEIAAALLCFVHGAYQIASVSPGRLPHAFAAHSARAMVQGLLSATEAR